MKKKDKDKDWRKGERNEQRVRMEGSGKKKTLEGSEIKWKHDNVDMDSGKNDK